MCFGFIYYLTWRALKETKSPAGLVRDAGGVSVTIESNRMCYVRLSLLHEHSAHGDA